MQLCRFGCTKLGLQHSLKPLLDMVQHIHGHRIHHGHLLSIVLEHEHHVEVLEVELHSLEVHELHVLERDHEGRPLGQVHERARRGLQQHGGAERGAGETELSRGIASFYQ